MGVWEYEMLEEPGGPLVLPGEAAHLALTYQV